MADSRRGKVNYAPTAPDAFMLPQNVSTSMAVTKKEYIEMLPTEQLIFTPQTQNFIKFQISSTGNFISWPESYFRCFFTPLDTNSTGAYDPLYDRQRHFDIGGITACFKSLEIYETATGMLIIREEEQNTYRAIKSLVGDSREDAQNHWFQADTTEAQLLYEKSTFQLTGVYAPAADFTIDVDLNLLTVTNWYNQPAGSSAKGQAYSYLDMIGGEGGSATIWDTFTLRISDGTNTNVFPGCSFSITADTGAIVGIFVPGYDTQSAADQAAALGGTAFSGLSYVTPADLTTSASTVVQLIGFRKAPTADTDLVSFNQLGRYICFKLQGSFFEYTFPLFLLKGGIEIRLELDYAQKAMITGGDWDGCLNASSELVTLGYSITSPRLIACMIQPHDDIKEEYSRLYQGEGLTYYVPSYRYRRNSGPTSNSQWTFQTHVGSRSTRRVYMVIKDSIVSESIGQVAMCNNSISRFLLAGIKDYQLQIGGYNFPLRAINLQGGSTSVLTTDLSEPFLQLLGSQGRNQWTASTRLTYGDYRASEYNVVQTGTSEVSNPVAKHFIMMINLSRDDGPNSIMTGQDLSVVPVNVIINRNLDYTDLNMPSGSNPVIYLFFEYDQVLLISAAGTIVSQ